MSVMSQVRTGPQKRPHLVGLYGPGGVGKSTFAASAPDPIFIGTDDGIATMDVASFPIVETWPQALAQIDALQNEKHDYKTCAIDTVNGLEPLLHAWLCKEARCNSIEEIDGGFGKGYVRAEEQWVLFWRKLKTLRLKMNVIALGHSYAKTREDIMLGEKFDRYAIKMHERAAAVFHESVDCNFFANFVVDFRTKKGAKKARAIGEGIRRMYTEERPWFLAKNRFDLPFEMELSWDEFADRAAAHKPKSTKDDMAKAFAGIEDEALAYLIKIGWLEEGQTINDLMESKRKSIANKADAFRKAVIESAQTETTNQETEQP